MNILKKVLTKLRRGSWFPFYYTFYTRCRIDDRTILLESRHGRALESSIFALLKELGKYPENQYRIVVCADRQHREQIRGKLSRAGLRVNRLVRFGGLAYYHELSRARYLVNDISFPGRFVKKEGQRYLNVWHGTPLKKMGKDDLEDRAFMGNMMRNFLMADLLLYPNRYMEEVMTSSFMLDKLYEGTILHTGYPRNDIFFHPEEGRKVRKALGYEGKRLIAYLPTHRGSLAGASGREGLEERFRHLRELDALLGEEELLLYKPHPLEQGDDLSELRHVRPFPAVWDTNQVLNACDALITDYSSVFFDFANTGRPILLFPYDREEYDRGRGVYLPLEALPFPKARSARELADLLHSGKGGDYGRLPLPDGAGASEALSFDRASQSYSDYFLTWENGRGSRDALEALLTGKLSCETAQPVKDDKPRVLLYAGDLSQNGVTAAFCNFYSLLNHDRCHYFVSFRTDVVKEDLSRMDRLPPEALLFPLASEMNLDPVTGLCQALYLKKGIKGVGIGGRLTRAYETEWKKHFPNVHFHHLVHYNGYENYILSLMQHAPFPVTVGVHSNMEEEVRVRHNASRPLLKDLYAACDSVLCVSENGAASVTSISGRREGVFVGPNCQSPSEIRRRAARPLAFDGGTKSTLPVEEVARILALEGQTRYICVGRFSPEKGILRLISAFHRFYPEHPNTWLFLVGGSGDLYEEACRQAGEGPAAGRIVLIRGMSNCMPLLAACHLLLVPSEYEGCPVVPYEADFLDVPCACSDVTGCHELMERWGGLLVPPGEEGLMEAMALGEARRIPLMHMDPGPDNEKTLQTFYRCIRV